MLQLIIKKNVKKKVERVSMTLLLQICQTIPDKGKHKFEIFSF